MARQKRSTTPESTRPITRIALYARVSTLNKQDPEMQLAELREYAARRGWQIVEEFADQGVSGCKESRPALNRLMSDAYRRRFAPAVETATLEYRRESDHFGRFLSERCTDRSGDQASGKGLFDAYVQWCADTGEKPESNNTFAKALADRGMQKKRTRKGTVYTGVGLRPRVRIAKPPQPAQDNSP